MELPTHPTLAHNISGMNEVCGLLSGSCLVQLLVGSALGSAFTHLFYCFGHIAPSQCTSDVNGRDDACEKSDSSTNRLVALMKIYLQEHNVKVKDDDLEPILKRISDSFSCKDECDAGDKVPHSCEETEKNQPPRDVNTTLRRSSSLGAITAVNDKGSPEGNHDDIDDDECNLVRGRRSSSLSLSLSGHFTKVDGMDRSSRDNLIALSKQRMREASNAHEHDSYDTSPDKELRIEVVSEESWFADDADVMQAKEFDERVLSKIDTLEESRLLLRRTRAVAMLAARLMAAPDEAACYEVVSRLLVPLFKVDRCSYVLLKDAEHMVVKQVTVNRKEHAIHLGMNEGFKGVVKKLKGTAVGVCAKTLKQHYSPRIKDSKFETQKQIHAMGLNTILATPILVDGNKFVGCIMICMRQEDAFKEYDRILISDVAAALGANIYAKRMRHSAELSNKISREMLHSMIPEKVIVKIQCFWDEDSKEYQSRRSGNDSSKRDSIRLSTLDESINEDVDSPEKPPLVDVANKVNLLNEINRRESEREDAGVVLDTSAMELNSTSQALYAENIDDVCIIFTDIVGFSRISLDLKPLQIMDLLQDLFSRFDSLCDVHGVMKLETIGDGYICTAGLFDEDLKNTEKAKRALAMASDMVKEARQVRIPGSDCFVEIRVGMHIGAVTCGVLGQRLPKLTVFGSSVNLAARMEQTSLPSRIRVTEDVYKLVSDDEEDLAGEYKVITVKNMGEVGTWLLDPR